MRLKRPTVGPRVCALVSFVVLSATAFTAASALALNPERHYEIVSPVYKGGYSITGVVAVAPDGERVAFGSLGAFAGDPANNVLLNYYIARRDEAVGWSTAPLTSPASISAWSAVVDFSSQLDSTLNELRLGPNFGRASNVGIEDEFLLHPTDLPDTAPNAPDPAPNFEVAGMVLKDLTETNFRMNYEGASSDFAHIVFEDPEVSAGQQLLAEAKHPSQLYDLALSLSCGGLGKAVCSEGGAAGAAGREPSLRLVGLSNKGKVVNPFCTASLGNDKESVFNAVSGDGSELFFRTGVDEKCAGNQLFVRLGGQRTLEVSRPLLPVCHEVPCGGAGERKSAQFRGASQDGSRVFFTSTEPLVAGETDTSKNLYMASIGCPEGEPACEPAGREVTGLVQVSRDPNAVAPAEVRDVVAVAPDGSRVYFVARGELLGPAELGALSSEGRALPRVGADNLYVYERDTRFPEGRTSFIAHLCSGPELSGVVEDIRCPSDLEREGSGVVERNDVQLWTSPQREAQLNVCARPSVSECAGDRETGRFLVFSSYGQLTADDTDTGRDVYRYDAVTGALERVSVGEDGGDANGNGDGFDATLAKSKTLISNTLYGQRDMDSRAISEDGSRIVFTTVEPLSPAAGNGLANAYEWHEGNVSLISTGSATRPVENVLISSSGRDVFFTTTQGLVPQDTDGQEDVYDAHECTASAPCFSPPPTEPEPCSGDACQGPLTNPAPLLVSGSVAQAPGENLPPPARATPKKKPKKASAKKKKPKAKRVRRAHRRGRTANRRGRR